MPLLGNIIDISTNRLSTPAETHDVDVRFCPTEEATQRRFLLTVTTLPYLSTQIHAHKINRESTQEASLKTAEVAWINSAIVGHLDDARDTCTDDAKSFITKELHKYGEGVKSRKVKGQRG